MSTRLAGSTHHVLEVRTAPTDVGGRLLLCFDAATDDAEAEVRLRRAAADYALLSLH